jgi:hypothetical protein
MKFTCAICLKTNYSFFPYKTECGHKFHKKCMEDWLLKYNTCPVCLTTIFDYEGRYNNQLIHININRIKKAISITQKFGGLEIRRIDFKNIPKFEANKNNLIIYETVCLSNTSQMEIRHIFETPNAIRIWKQLKFKTYLLADKI